MRFQAGMAYHQQALVARRRTPATQVKYAMVERRFDEFVRADTGRHATLADLNVTTVRRWMVWLSDQLVPRKFGGAVKHGSLTIQQHASVLKFMSRLLADEWPEEFPHGDPLARMRLSKVQSAPIEVFKREEVERLLALCQSTVQPIRNTAMLLFFLDTGCRLSEVLNLRREHLDLAGNQRNGRARILMSKQGKSRSVFFGGKCSKALSRYFSTERDRLASRQPFVFLGRTGRQMTASAIQIMLKKLGRLAGMSNVRCSPHTFRHTFATWYLKKHPGQIEQLRLLLGHSTLAMVLVYAKLAESDVEDTYESLMDDWTDAAVSGKGRR